MKIRRITKTLFLSLGLLGLMSQLHSANSGEIQMTGFSMTIQGSSTLHDWESEITELNAENALALEDGTLVAEGRYQVEIPVKEIESPHDKMDRLTYEALKAEEHPVIRYELEELKPIDDQRYQSAGKLTIGGQTRPLEMEVAISPVNNGKFTLSGGTGFDMSEFNIKPPSLMFGTIKVRDAVEVNFELNLNINTNK